MIKVTVEKEGYEPIEYRMMEHDQLILSGKGDILARGRNAVSKFKLRSLEKANRTLREMLDRERREVDLSFIPIERLLEEVQERVDR